MAYYLKHHLEDTILFHDSNNEEFIRNAIEIDEHLLPVIALLNDKGYKTTFCCSGHVYPSLNTSIISIEDMENPPEEVRILDTHLIDREKNMAFVDYISNENRNLYIAFNHDTGKYLYNNRLLPEGFEWDEIDVDDDAQYCMRYWYESEYDEVFGFFTERTKIITQLFLWVVSLPTL